MVLLQQMDMDVLMWLQENLRQEGLDQVFSFFTRLGNNGELWIALLVVLFIIPPFRRMALTAAVSLISSALLVEFVIKPLVARVRPYVTVKGLFSRKEAILFHPATVQRHLPWPMSWRGCCRLSTAHRFSCWRL